MNSGMTPRRCLFDAIPAPCRRHHGKEVDAMFQGRAAWAEIDLDAVAHNVRALKTKVGDRTQLLAIVKANGYGHGALPVAETALEAGATWLGVNMCDEGVQLRHADIDAPILVVGHTPVCQAETVVRHRLTPTVNTIELAEALNAYASPSNPLPVHVKVDTGLSRFGMLPDQVTPFVLRIQEMSGLHFQGLFTHFASADSADKSSARRQLQVYLDTLARLSAAGVLVEVRHVAASGAALDMPETHLDMVRCGITIYGLYPSDEVDHTIGLKPALSLKSCIARLRELPPGTGVGYGATYVAERPLPAALVPIGYADGIKRSYSNRGCVLVRGRRAPVIGRVSMDQLVVDVSAIAGVAEGDEVTLIGRQGGAEITCDEMATVMGTINYEVVVGLAPRLPRIYMRNGQEAGYSTLVEHVDMVDASAGDVL
jgi:alanine racemase